MPTTKQLRDVLEEVVGDTEGFDRWLAKERAAARAAALRDAASAFDVLDREALHDEEAGTAVTAIIDDPAGWLRDLANPKETAGE